MTRRRRLAQALMCLAAVALAPLAPAQAVRPANLGGPGMPFRNEISSAQFEAQAAAEYREIVDGAAHSGRLYPPGDPRVVRVHALFDRLEPYALKWSDRVKNWHWDIAVIRSPDIRMYCLPGGKVVIWSGLLDRVDLTDNELALLFAHDIAHAVREHARARLNAQLGVHPSALEQSQLFGLADLGEFPLGIGSQLLAMRYGADDETEADVIGGDIAARAGFDPRAAISLWDKLAAATREDHESGFIYLHPYSTARRDDLIRRLADLLPLYAKAVGKPLDALPDYAGVAHPTKRAAAATP